MNNYQNYPSSKYNFPANNVAEYSAFYGSDQWGRKRAGKNEEKSGENKPRGHLNGTLDSEGSQRKSVKKKSSRELRAAVEERNKSKRPDRKPQRQEPSSEKCVRKPNYLAIIESQLAKAKAVGKMIPQKGQTSQYISDLFSSSNELSTNRRARPRSLRKTSENRRAPLNSLFTQAGKKLRKAETVIKAKRSSASAEQTLSQKASESSSHPAELMGTSSESGKRHINEILKSHAQKILAKSIPMKEYSFQKVADLIKKVQNSTGVGVGGSAKDEKEALGRGEVKHERIEEIKLEEVKGKASEKLGREVNSKQENNEDKRTVPDSWLKLPRSNELERRLKGTWEDGGSMFPQNKNAKSGENSEDEEMGKNPGSASQEEEKKNEKRTTYTDRLLLLRMIGKDLEEKKRAAENAAAQPKETNSSPKTSANKEQENLVRKQDIVAVNPKCSRDAPPKVLDHKEGKLQEVEHVYRTKQTRSAELRDIVSQAIKEHKIFCIFDNHSYIVRPVREELLSRGWLEVVPDRRLIPRRRPPPMGPTLEREKSVAERNCNTLEAILSAKETFADELQETVSKTQSFRWTIEKPKSLPPPAPTILNKKSSEDSLSEAPSQFRIIPPTSERRRNNIEIREFNAKYHAILTKGIDRQREIRRLREKEKNAKSLKTEKSKSPGRNADSIRTKANDKSNAADTVVHTILPGSKSFQDILNSIRENNKTIVHAASEIRNLDDKTGTKAELGALFEAAATGEKELETIVMPKTQDKMVNTSQEKPVWVNGKPVFSETEVKAMSKLIQSNNARIHFMWLSIKPAIHLKCFNYSPEIVNKFQRTTFCTKIGLWSHLSNIQWYAHEVHFPAKSPRMYNTGEADDLQAFFEDFQMTACIGLLKWLSDTFFEKGLKAVQTKKGKVPLKAFEFAIKQCERYIRFKENEDLCLLEETNIQNDEWHTFLQWFYIITNDHGKVQETSSAQLMVVYTKAVETLKSIRRHWPEIDIDGRLNIWIMKPYCASCGRGIFMTNNVYYIGQHSKYIVQKYIEKPLLIYNTKFDIRQWFMITKLTPLEIWMYKECYLRFCTQPFALRNLHESVHLSNNSVQRKYISFRDPSLPDQNMWDSNTFQLYLKTIGQPNTWEEIIYPGMKDAIVSTMLASQDTFDGPRKSWFEVYGADFMLSANLKEGPWLIEINENPAMDPSTKVTARLCPQMLRDVIKVVVDKRANKNASTGQWELIYRQNYSPSFGTVDLDIKGKKIARVPYGKTISNLPPHPSSSPVYLKKYSSNDMEPDRTYELVKSYEKRHNNRGDATDYGRARGGAKKTRKNNSSRVSPRRRSPAMESPGRVSTSDFTLQVMGNKKGTGAQDQSNFPAEKYKFTKFYNV